MRFSFRIGFVLVATLAFIVETSCGDEGASNDLGPGNDGGGAPTGTDARANDPDAESPMSTMRFAHLAPGLGRIDFCYQAARTGTFVGPVLGGAGAPKTDASADAEAGLVVDASLVEDAANGEAGAPGLRSASYRTVSKYLNLGAAGPITIAVVEAGATSCANALVKADVTLDPGKLSTVALFSRRADGGPLGALEIAAFTDDRTTASDKLRVRLIHAALGTESVAASGPLAVRAVASTTTLLTDRVEPRKVATASQAVSVDGLGYVTAPPVPPPAAIAIGPASTDDGADAGFDPWQSAAKDLDLRGGSLHTAFVLTGASEARFEVLWCADTTTSGDQTTCELVR